MKLIAVMSVVLMAQLAFAESTGDYPKNPDATLTPGELCSSPNEFRYPENIAYCDRMVEPKTKHEIISKYDDVLKFKIESMPRSDFKIDHYIPLCMGGSNNTTNLWPQHKSVYEITDPLEEALCEKMADGVLKQADAILMIKDAKHHLDKVPAILEKVNSL